MSNVSNEQGMAYYDELPERLRKAIAQAPRGFGPSALEETYYYFISYGEEYTINLLKQNGLINGSN